MIVCFHLGDAPMGSELDVSQMPELESRRTLRVRVNGTDAIAKIEIVCNNRDVHTVEGSGADMVLAWEDTRPLSDINLPAARHWPRPFTFYYVRVTQQDGHMAWASPIWLSDEGGG